MVNVDVTMAPPDDERLLTWVALLRAQAAVVDGVESELIARHGLPVSWHEVLVRLARADGGALRMQELAREVLLSKSGLTRLADRMEDAGLIERSKCGTDRRGTYAVITEAGRRMLRESFPAFMSAVDQHFAGRLSADELSALRTLLGKVLEGQPEESCTPADLGAEEPVPQPVG
jgi:DNA-binding MarR family transcriptional regulator